MPQFDLNQFSSQIFWLILCFAILYVYTIFYTVPRLNKIYQTRLKAIEGKIARGQQLQDKCAQLTLKYQNELTKTRKTNQNKVDALIHQLNEQVHEQKLAIDHQMKTKIAHEKEQISVQMSTKMNASQNEIEALASTLADQILNANTNGTGQQHNGELGKPICNQDQGIS